MSDLDLKHEHQDAAPSTLCSNCGLMHPPNVARGYTSLHCKNGDHPQCFWTGNQPHEYRERDHRCGCSCHGLQASATLVECVLKQRQVMAHLLKQIGEPGPCRGCGAEMRWVTHLNGKKTPYTVEGQSHFADCPAAKDFKK